MMDNRRCPAPSLPSCTCQRGLSSTARRSLQEPGGAFAGISAGPGGPRGSGNNAQATRADSAQAVLTETAQATSPTASLRWERRASRPVIPTALMIDCSPCSCGD
jgi:hypothetical protein